VSSIVETEKVQSALQFSTSKNTYIKLFHYFSPHCIPNLCQPLLFSLCQQTSLPSFPTCHIKVSLLVSQKVVSTLYTNIFQRGLVSLDALMRCKNTSWARPVGVSWGSDGRHHCQALFLDKIIHPCMMYHDQGRFSPFSTWHVSGSITVIPPE
jgi:hypothetical protein